MKAKSTLTAKESQFVDYLLMFYGPGGVYAGPRDFFRDPMTREEAKKAAVVQGAKASFDGDSIDREQARDLVLAWRER